MYQHMESPFLLHVGNNPRMRIIQHFIDGREFEYTLTDLLDAHVSWRTLNKIVPELANVGIIQKTRKVGRATLYKLNNKNPVTRQLMNIYEYTLTRALNEVDTENELASLRS